MTENEYEISATATSAETQKKSVTELAKEVIAGKWGNGSDRKNRLTQAGYDCRCTGESKRTDEIRR